MAVTAIDGGGSTAGPPEDLSQVHRFAAGESLTSLAERYGVTPQAIREANPQIFQEASQIRQQNARETGSVIYTGEEVTIPAPPMSVGEDPITGEADHPSLDWEVGVEVEGELGGSVTWNPDGGEITLSQSQTLAPPGQTENSPVRVEASRQTDVTLGTSSSDGTTSFTASTRASTSFSTEVEAGRRSGGFEAEASAGSGFTAEYKVTLPGENRPVTEAMGVNPFDPTTIPVGGSVTLNGEAFAETELAGSFRYIGTETAIENSAGVSYSVARTDQHTVTVTMGPTEAIEAFNGVGVRAGDLSVMVGRQDNLSGATLRTAEFDISTPGGQAAYAHFSATGQVAHETPGVDNVATIERVDYSSQTQLRADLGPVSASFGGPQNLGSVVQTTYPDGSYALTTELQYSGNVPLQVTQRFDAAGDEVVTERSYQFTIDGDRPEYGWFDRFLGANEGAEEDMIASNLNLALTGNPDGAGPVEAGDKTEIVFSEGQLQALMSQTRSAGEALHPSSPLNLLVGGSDGQPPATTFDFAVAMARNLGGDPYGFADRLAQVSQMADGDVRNGWDRIDAEVRTP